MTSCVASTSAKKLCNSSCSQQRSKISTIKHLKTVAAIEKMIKEADKALEETPKSEVA